MTQVRFALESVFEGVHGAGELGGVAGDGSGAAIRVADQVRSRAITCPDFADGRLLIELVPAREVPSSSAFGHGVF